MAVQRRVPVGDKQVRYIPNDSLWRTPVLGSDGLPLVIGPNGLADDITLTCTTTGLIDALGTGTNSWVIVDHSCSLPANERVAEALAVLRRRWAQRYQ